MRYNRFVRWRRAGVWGRIMDALAATHDAAVQMIDTSIARVHQHAATRYDKLAANYLAFIQLASIRLWLRVL
jgi:transposase